MTATRASAASTLRRISDLREPKHGDHEHQSKTDRQSRRAPGVDDVERRRCDVNLVGSKLISRVDDEEQECQGCRYRDHVQERPSARAEHADDGRHPHMLVALEGEHRAQHGEPQEEDAGEFVRPHERGMEDISPNDAR